MSDLQQEEKQKLCHGGSLNSSLAPETKEEEPTKEEQEEQEVFAEEIEIVIVGADEQVPHEEPYDVVETMLPVGFTAADQG